MALAIFKKLGIATYPTKQSISIENYFGFTNPAYWPITPESYLKVWRLSHVRDQN